MKKHKVPIPKGMKVKRELWPTTNSDRVVVEFEPIKKELPKTWEELKRVKGYSVDENCNLVGFDYEYHAIKPRVIWPTKELAYASIALSKLLQLRDHYNDGWGPDWKNGKCDKFVIIPDRGKIIIDSVWALGRVMTFKSEYLANEFLKNFAQLIEEAKILL